MALCVRVLLLFKEGGVGYCVPDQSGSADTLTVSRILYRGVLDIASVRAKRAKKFTTTPPIID